MKSRFLNFQKTSTVVLLLIAMAYFPYNQIHAADRYWIATTTQNWNSTANWSTSTGGSGGASVPGSGDIAYFNSLKNGNCSIDATVNVTGINISGYTGTITQGTGNTITIGTSGFTQSSGTFTGGNSSITLSGAWGRDFTLSGGTFNSTSGSFTIPASWIHTSGTFNHNNGTVVFTGSWITIDVMTTETFYNLTFNGGGINMTAGDTYIVQGTLSLTTGKVSTGTLEARGNVTVASTYSNVNNGSATLLFSGGADQTFDLTGATTKFDGPITLNKSGGQVTLASDLTMTVSGTVLTLTSGTLNFNGKTLTTSPATSVTTINGTVTFTGGGTFSGTDLTQSAGTFTAGSTTLTLTRSFTLSGGTFNAPSGAFNVGNDWTHTAGGTFNHNNGTVVFTATLGWITIDVMTTETFNNLTFNSSISSNGFNMTAGDTFIILGTLSLTTGKVNNGTLEAQGNVTVASTYKSVNGASATLLFSGSAAQTFDLTGAIDKFDGPITLNKSGGQVNLASDLTMTVSGTVLTLTAGTLNLNGKTLTTSPWTVTTINGTVTFTGGGTLSGYTLNQTAGTFTAGSTTLTFTSTFTLNGGTFNSSSGTFTVGGEWTHTAGGTFNHNNGTVVFTSINWSTIDVMTTETFSNLTFNASSGNPGFTIAAGDNLIALGTLSLTNGSVGTGTLEAQGNVTVASTYDGGNATLKFSGSADQTFDLTGAAGNFNAKIIINKSSGKVTLLSDLTLDGISQKLELVNGNIVTSQTAMLTITCNASIIGGGSSSWINGPLTLTLCTSQPTELFYPTGKGTIYRPVWLTPEQANSTPTAYTVEQFEGTPPSYCLPSDLCGVSSVRWYRVTKGPGAPLILDPIKLSYGPDDGVTNAQHLRIAKQDGTCWLNIGGTGTADGTGTIISTVDFTTFGDFVLAQTVDCDNPLPVELTSFSAIHRNDAVMLKWTTATEKNNYGFDIERCTDIKQNFWERIGFVPGHGTSNISNTYNFTDVLDASTMKAEKIRYRLHQFDRDGSNEYSSIVEVTITSNPDALSLIVSPSPSRGNATAYLSLRETQPVSLTIYDVIGRIVKTYLSSSTLQSGSYIYPLDMNSMKNGMYYVVLQTSLGVRTQPLVIQK